MQVIQKQTRYNFSYGIEDALQLDKYLIFVTTNFTHSLDEYNIEIVYYNGHYIYIYNPMKSNSFKSNFTEKDLQNFIEGKYKKYTAKMIQELIHANSHSTEYSIFNNMKSFEGCFVSRIFCIIFNKIGSTQQYNRIIKLGENYAAGFNFGYVPIEARAKIELKEIDSLDKISLIRKVLYDDEFRERVKLIIDNESVLKKLI